MFKIWYRDFLVWSRFLFSSFVANLGEPFLYLLAMGYGLGRSMQFEGGNYPQFIAPALLIVAAMNSASFETTFSSYTRMSVQKTFDAIAVTPISLKEIILGEILWATTKACFAAVLLFIVLLGFGLIPNALTLLALPVVFIAGWTFSSFGMLATSLAKSYDFFNYYFTLFISPMFLFSGTFFPLDKLPTIAKTAAWFLPLTHGVHASRELFEGRIGLSFLSSIAWLAITGYLVSWIAVRKLEKRLYV